MIYKRRTQTSDVSALSAKEQAKGLREDAVLRGLTLLDDQDENAAEKLIKKVKSGEIESVIILDKDHGDTKLEEPESTSPNFEITMLNMQ